MDLSSSGWEEEELSADSVQAAIERRFQEMPSFTGHAMIDLTQNQYDEEADQAERENEIKLEPEIAQVIEVIDLTKPEPVDLPIVGKLPRRTRAVIPPKRNLSITLPNYLVDSYKHNGMELKCGSTVEITPIPELNQASFLYIKLIIITEPGPVLRGLPMTRTRNLRGRLQRLRNELAMILEVDQDDTRPDEDQAAIEVSIDMVQKPRVCHITNKEFPELRFQGGIYHDTAEVEETGPLVCRWKCKRIWVDTLKRVNHKPPHEFVMARITAEEVPRDKFRTSSSYLINTWRGGKVLGGSYITEEPEGLKPTVNVDVPEVQDDMSDITWARKKPGQQYSLADMFCGAGGASCGARSAGFRIKLSCDNAPGACNTYRLEFPEVDLRQENMYDFIISMRSSTYRVDVLHLSPPCQYWSPAHTTPGVDDEANIAILFSCHELVKILRPRIFTLEQTFGILHPRFEFYFNALIHGFTQHGYSIRWRVVNLLEWGAPSQRQRLVMLGSCPGEPLPPFPAATHSREPKPGDGKKPYRTVRQMLRKIPRDAAAYDDLHEPGKLKRLHKPRWNPDIPLARTITCGGGVGNYHYSGRRDFTPREYAVLQGFPVDWRFQRPQQKKQIGNAFPPLVVHTLFKHLRRWLEHNDQVLPDADEVSSESEHEEEEEYIVSEYEESDHDGYGGGLDYDSDVQYIGKREIDQSDSEVEFLGGRSLFVKDASVVTINDSSSDDDNGDDNDNDGMEIDAMSQDAHSPGVCVGAAAQLGGGGMYASGPIVLD